VHCCNCNLPEVIILPFRLFARLAPAALQHILAGQSLNENAIGSTCTTQQPMR
jgi:hypothetical protein